jgi:nucleoside-diphosphate-sugar epimerase
VHVLDDLSTGSIENIRHLKGRPGFEYTIESLNNTAIVAERVDDADVVYHLAAAVGVQLIVESPVRTIETNVHCTEIVLAQASKKKKPVFVASTSEVYGKSRDLPYREDGDLMLGPTVRGRWSYACSKALDEFLRDHDRSLRGSLRARLRGHAAARAGHEQDPEPARLAFAQVACRDSLGRHRRTPPSLRPPLVAAVRRRII